MCRLVVVGPRVFHRDLHLATVTFLAVGRDVVEYQRVVVHEFGVPHLDIEAFLASVQGVGTVVDGHIVLFAVQCELTFGDTVAKASNQPGEVRLG